MQDIVGLHRHLIESSPVGAWVLDAQGVTVWSNPEMCRLLGRSPDQVEGMAAAEAFDELGRRQFAAFLERMRDGAGTEPEVECLLHLPDGSTRWVLISATTMPDSDGSLFVLRALDYDRRRALNDELTQAQALGRIGSWRLDYATGLASCSEELYRVVGRDPAAGPLTLEDFADLAVDDSDLARRLSGEFGSFGDELRIRRGDGAIAWVRLQAEITSGSDGRPLRILVTAQEITEQKHQEIQLREMLDNREVLSAITKDANESVSLAQILDLSLSRMLRFDADARLTTFLPVHDETDRLELLPRYPGRDYSGSDPQALAPTPNEESLAREVYADRETRMEYDGSSGLVHVAHAVVYHGEVVTVVVLTATDRRPSRARWMAVATAAQQAAERVIERERSSAALAEARDAAMSGSRQKSEFLATMSHEIRTPMNGVIGLNELLLKTGLDTNQRRLAEGVQAAGQSLLTVINDILDFSKIEAGKLRLENVDFEVRPLFEGVLALQGEVAHTKGIELAVEVPPGVPAFIRGDPTRLGQVLTNLISNAVKFTREGEVIVRCQVVEQEPSPGSEESEVVLKVEVSDTGIGIPPDAQASLFDAFSQAEQSTTRKFGGTGLGLAICRQLVAAIGGEIGLVSEVGRGTTFWFTGRFGAGDPVLAAHPDKGARHLLEGRRMLVVDDNASNRRILTEILTEWHTEVESSAAAEDAVARILRAAQAGRAFDVVLLDLVMPDYTGLELAAMITRSTDEPWPTMLLLSSAQSVEKEWLESAGIARSLTKPVRRSALFDSLVDILAEKHGVEALTSGTHPVASEQLGRRILVVEDNDINQMVALGVLDALGYTADVASDGEQAVAMSAGTPYDAIVMDVQMPRMDGYTATRLIREREGEHSRVPIIAMTASAVEGESERCLAAGMDDFLTKPLQPDLLRDVLSARIAEGDPTSKTPTVPASSQEAGSATGRPTTDTAPNLEVLDPTRLDALRRMGPAAPALVAQAVERFVGQAGESVAAIRRAVVADDSADMGSRAHQLGGSAANLGARQVTALCRELEVLGHQVSTIGATELIDTLEQALTLAVRALRAEQQ